MSTTTLATLIAFAVLALAAGFALGWQARRKREALPAGDQGNGAASGHEAGDLVSAQARIPRARPESPDPSLGAPSRGAPAAAPRSAERRAADLAASPAQLLAQAQSWGYQLQKLSVARAAASPFDVLVVDYAKDGDDESALKPAEVAKLQAKPDGGRRVVLAYLSIGEAESYRSYWRKDWARTKPGWLLKENPEWEENYAVCFWDAGWRDLLCGRPDAYLDRILAQGFDGIYLDKCDVVDDLRRSERKAAASRPDLDGDMVRLVQDLAGYARARRPGFLVVMQNAEQLLERPELRDTIDGLAKEELLFGVDASEKPNSREDIAWSRERLDLMRRDNKPVFVVEYLDDRAKIAKAATTIADLGYVLYVSDKSRELDRLVHTAHQA